MVAGLVALGLWQLERRAWKHRLLAQIERNMTAPAVPPPQTAEPSDAYRRILARGQWLPGRDTLVRAGTALGYGFWVLSPLATDRGTLLVNRGFVPSATAPRPLPAPQVTGLLRLSEPGGTLLRGNDPGADRWYSRDVAAIARRRGIPDALPYFVDADRVAGPGPVGGLTTVRLPDNHLVYALTWFALAVMTAWYARRL